MQVGNRGGSLGRLVQPTNPLFAVVSLIINLASSVMDFVLMVMFWQSNDIVWAAFYLFFIVLSTLINIIVTCYEHPNSPFRVLAAFLQLGPIGDCVDSFYEEELSVEKQMSLRTKRMMSSVIRSLPISFILTYVLLLDLSNRIDEHFLGAVLLLSFLSFAVGVTHFIAGNESLCTGILVFCHIFAQFVFRMLAVCSVCVRFELFGAIGMAVSWLLVYLYGPQGTHSFWIRCLTCSRNEKDSCSVPILKAFFTPLFFFIIFEAVFSKREQHNNQLVLVPVRVHHCFDKVGYILFRMVENAIFVACFVFIPHDYDGRSSNEYEAWLSNPITVGVVSLVSLLTVLITLCFFGKPSEYQPQTDEAIL